MVLDTRGKLIAHLRRHERVGNMFTLEIVVQGDEVQTDLFRNDMNGSAAGQGGIHVHHASIKAIRSVGSHPMFRFQVVVTLVPMTEAHEVAVFQLAALGHTRRA